MGATGRCKRKKKEKGKKDKSGMKGKKSSGTMPGGAQVYSLRQGSSEATLVWCGQISKGIDWLGDDVDGWSPRELLPVAWLLGCFCYH